jgi:hypothetical protein
MPVDVTLLPPAPFKSRLSAESPSSDKLLRKSSPRRSRRRAETSADADSTTSGRPRQPRRAKASRRPTHSAWVLVVDAPVVVSRTDTTGSIGGRASRRAVLMPPTRRLRLLLSPPAGATSRPSLLGGGGGGCVAARGGSSNGGTGGSENGAAGRLPAAPVRGGTSWSQTSCAGTWTSRSPRRGVAASCGRGVRPAATALPHIVTAVHAAECSSVEAAGSASWCKGP